ncbi:ABC transporter permease [Sulfuracidifex metallicus]|uniref:ABC transporter permease n=1 Tax=Sulfuracidifex metallicus TaxID=47303 RepID=UPI002274111C|nr:ABC transporter permease [Sulfuracidifex metallicus]MCY0849445.1 ABC transporter permease [Sulfuracidifex metallicus]
MMDRVIALYKRELKRTFRSKFMWLTILIQPLMWLIFFGSSFSGAPAQFLESFFHTKDYIAFILPGELSISMVTVGMFSSMSLVQDKRFGYLRRVLVTPTRKSAIFLAKVMGGMTRGLLQIPVMLLASLALGVSFNLSATALVEWIIGMVFLGIGFSSLYSIITINSSDWQAPGVISNLINFPLMFSSTALFPRAFFPSWLKIISDGNPITYAAEVGRDALVYGDPPTIDYMLFLVLFGTVFLILGIIVSDKYLKAE